MNIAMQDAGNAISNMYVKTRRKKRSTSKSNIFMKKHEKIKGN